MIDKFAGYATDIRNWERRLKEMDSKKANPAKVKEIQEIIKNLKDLLKEKQEKKEQRKKLKDEKAAETSKDEVTVEAVVETEAAPTCALCGGVSFKTLPEYHNHLNKEHPAKPVNAPVKFPEKLPTPNYKPMDVEKKKDIVKRVEETLPLVSEKEPKAELEKFAADDVVVPSRGEESTGRVLRHDSPSDLCYVLWESGPLKDKHVAGGYYMSDLKKKAEGNPPAPALETEIIPSENSGLQNSCSNCSDHTMKEADLKSKYEGLLKDLKEEREAHYSQGNPVWTARLDQKIKELEDAMAEKFGNEKTSGAQNDSEGLVLMDHTPPRANTSADEIGRDTHDEFQDENAMPMGINSADHSKCSDTSGTSHAGPMVKHKHGGESTMYCDKHLPSHIKYNRPEPNKTSSLKIASIPVSVFKKNWMAVPFHKEGKLGYDLVDEKGNKILHISPLNGKDMNTEHLKWAAERELTKNLKQAKLVSKIAMLPEGSKVFVLAHDKANKRVKIANLEHGIRAWVSDSKIKLVALESQSVQHNGHSDKVLGSSKAETLLDCVEGGPVWVSSTELLDNNRPSATPESLNDLEALKTALPPTIPNERGYLNNPPVQATLKIKAHIRHEDGKWIVYNHDYTKKLGTYPSKEAAEKRLRQIEYFKHEGSKKPFSKKEAESDTHKINRLRLKIKELNPIKDQTEYRNILRELDQLAHTPGRKKAEVLTDPYQSLTTHITEMKSRMTQVQERLQSAPVTKAAGEEDNSKMELPELFEDLSMGINLLETKLGGENIDQDLHSNVEELENLLWKLEEECGITPKLSEEEKEEPEHKEIVEEMEKKADLEFHPTSPELRKAITLLHSLDEDQLLNQRYIVSLLEIKGMREAAELIRKMTPEELEDFVVNNLEKEAATTTTLTTTTSPIAPAAPAAPTTPQSDDAPSNAPDDASPSCALCGGLTFADFAGYQNHMEYTHKSNTMPTNPTQKLEPTNVTSKKIAAVTDETIEEGFGTPPPAATTPAVVTPTIQNVQPTDQDNLEVPIAKPSSPAAPGTVWVFNSDPAVMAYVLMPNTSDPGKTI